LDQLHVFFPASARKLPPNRHFRLVLFEMTEHQIAYLDLGQAWIGVERCSNGLAQSFVLKSVILFSDYRFLGNEFLH
jgi:hypothetical protein